MQKRTRLSVRFSWFCETFTISIHIYFWCGFLVFPAYFHFLWQSTCVCMCTVCVKKAVSSISRATPSSTQTLYSNAVVRIVPYPWDELSVVKCILGFYCADSGHVDKRNRLAFVFVCFFWRSLSDDKTPHKRDKWKKSENLVVSVVGREMVSHWQRLWQLRACLCIDQQPAPIIGKVRWSD